MSITSGSTCEKPFVPVNADFSCAKTKEGVNCSLICRQGYSLAQHAVHSYFCANNGIWEPPRSPDRPDCSCEYCCYSTCLSFPFIITHASKTDLIPYTYVVSKCIVKYYCCMCLLCLVNRIANNGFKPFEMLFKASRCDDLNLLKSFTGEFTTVLKETVRSGTRTLSTYNKSAHTVNGNNDENNFSLTFLLIISQVPNICGGDDVTCKLEMMSPGQCLEYNYDYPNGFAIGKQWHAYIDRILSSQTGFTY